MPRTGLHAPSTYQRTMRRLPHRPGRAVPTSNSRVADQPHAQPLTTISVVAKELARHRAVPGDSSDHPYKGLCACGAWSYVHETHVAAALHAAGHLAPAAEGAQPSADVVVRAIGGARDRYSRGITDSVHVETNDIEPPDLWHTAIAETHLPGDR